MSDDSDNAAGYYEHPLPVDERGQYVLDLGPLGYVQKQGPGNHAGTKAAHTSSQTEDWYTAPEVCDRVRELYGGAIDLDPMSCPEANEIVRAEKIYTAADDAFVQEWHGNLMLNPPWANSKRALAKLRSEMQAGHTRQCVLVLNANSMTTRWFAPLLMTPLCVPSYRIRNYAPRWRESKTGPTSGTVLAYLGPEVTAFARIFSQLGTILYCMRPASAEALDRAVPGEDEDW